MQLNKSSVFKPYEIIIFQELTNENISKTNHRTTNNNEIEIDESNNIPIFMNKNNHKKYRKIKKIVFKSFLGKKRKNSNFVKCFKCQIDDCPILFETNDEMIAHIKTHDKTIKCPYEGCNCSYINEKNYEKHLKSHFEIIKKFKCPFPGCGKKFTALYNQKIHYRIHSGERPYKCNECGNDYYDRANYKYHIKTAHINHNMKDISCLHNGICHKFKSKKTRILHHDKIENECRKEKNLILRLITGYNKAIIDLIKKNNEEEYLSSLKEYNEIEKDIIKIKNISLDKEVYDSLFNIKNN